jgi:hypothetical protein
MPEVTKATTKELAYARIYEVAFVDEDNNVVIVAVTASSRELAIVEASAKITGGPWKMVVVRTFPE